MGFKDVSERIYMDEPDVFADAFNFAIYHGKKVIHPENLREADSAELLGVDKVSGRKGIERQRDILKLNCMKEDGKVVYLLLGLEAQSRVDYSMPVREMLNDAMRYVKQVEQAAAGHRRNRDYGTEAEYLSGLHKEDKLIPVVTLVVLFDAGEWDGPKSLKEILAIPDKEVDEAIQDYKLNLLIPGEITESDFSKFHTDLGGTMGFIKHSKDKQEMENWLQGSGEIELRRTAVNLINACTDLKLEIKEGEQTVKMCKAWEDMKAEMLEKGEKIGEARGEARGEAKGEARSEIRRMQQLVQYVRNAMAKLGYSAEETMNVLGVSESDRAAVNKMLRGR